MSRFEPESALSYVAELIKSGKGTLPTGVALTAAKKIAVLAGAGISTSAGIPDFRSPGTGLYDNLAALNLPFPEAVFSLDYFHKRPEPFWTLARDLYPGKFLPTPTHYFLALLHKKHLLQRVWTQNIDTLETAAGVPDYLVIEAHGSFRTAHCLKCRREASTEHVLSGGVREGKVVRCGRDKCKGLVKPDIVFFGEGLPDDFFLMQYELRDETDLVLVLGTSLQVMPFAGLVDHVPRKVPRMLINREAVGPFESLAHDQRRGQHGAWLGDADAAIWQLADELGWSAELEAMVIEGRKALEQSWAERERLGKPQPKAQKDLVEDVNKAAGEVKSDEAATKAGAKEAPSSTGATEPTSEEILSAPADKVPAPAPAEVTPALAEVAPGASTAVLAEATPVAPSTTKTHDKDGDKDVDDLAAELERVHVEKAKQ